MKNSLLILVLLISACVIRSQHPNYTRSFQFKYEVALEPTYGEKLELWIPIPQSNEVQTISNLTFNTNGLSYSIKNENSHGNKYLYVIDENGTTKPINISMIFDVSRKEHGRVSYNNVNPDLYLGSYSTVPVGNIFSSIIHDNHLSKYEVKGIYEHVLSNMHYSKPKSVEDHYYNEPWLKSGEIYGIKGVSRDDVVKFYQEAERGKSDYTFGKGNSLYACDIGVGNCTDYHSYFMSLGRTLGIPVRFLMGFSIPSEVEGIVAGYHCWADYYEKGKGWFPIDISEADKDSTKTDYYFGTVDYNRVNMMVGRDFVLEKYDNGPINFFIYPLLEINNKKSTAFNKTFSYKNL